MLLAILKVAALGLAVILAHHNTPPVQPAPSTPPWTWALAAGGLGYLLGRDPK